MTSVTLLQNKYIVLFIDLGIEGHGSALEFKPKKLPSRIPISPLVSRKNAADLDAYNPFMTSDYIRKRSIPQCLPAYIYLPAEKQNPPTRLMLHCAGIFPAPRCTEVSRLPCWFQQVSRAAICDNGSKCGASSKRKARSSGFFGSNDLRG